MTICPNRRSARSKTEERWREFVFICYVIINCLVIENALPPYRSRLSLDRCLLGARGPGLRRSRSLVLARRIPGRLRRWWEAVVAGEGEEVPGRLPARCDRSAGGEYELPGRA